MFCFNYGAVSNKESTCNFQLFRFSAIALWFSIKCLKILRFCPLWSECVLLKVTFFQCTPVSLWQVKAILDIHLQKKLQASEGFSHNLFVQFKGIKIEKQEKTDIRSHERHKGIKNDITKVQDKKHKHSFWHIFRGNYDKWKVNKLIIVASGTAMSYALKEIVDPHNLTHVTWPIERDRQRVPKNPDSTKRDPYKVTHTTWPTFVSQTTWPIQFEPNKVIYGNGCNLV